MSSVTLQPAGQFTREQNVSQLALCVGVCRRITLLIVEVVKVDAAEYVAHG